MQDDCWSAWRRISVVMLKENSWSFRVVEVILTQKKVVFSISQISECGMAERFFSMIPGIIEYPQ